MSDFEQNNGNIFADLGYPEADQTLVRAQLLSRIIEIIRTVGCVRRLQFLTIK
jgi:hypothetical protein